MPENISRAAAALVEKARADGLPIEPGGIEGAGKDGQITVDDVKQAIAALQE